VSMSIWSFNDVPFEVRHEALKTTRKQVIALLSQERQRDAEYNKFALV